MANILTENISEDFKDLINSTQYRFNIALVSLDGRYQELKIGAINSLVIEDDITNYYHKGYIIIDNVLDAVERVADVVNRENILSQTTFTPSKGFLFKGDSRDMLVVDILPKLQENNGYTTSENIDKAFRLLFKFAIYNSEEITGTIPGQKFKKLYFWDIYHEILREKNSYFATANYIDVKDVQSLSNRDRGIYTGDAIKAFLTEFFNKDDGLEAKFNKNFDKGATKIFFSSPASYKGIDCLEYLLGRHVSDDNTKFDSSLLRIERFTSEFSLKSIGQYFKSAIGAGEQNTSENTNYIETFKLGEYSDSNNEFQIVTRSFTPSKGLFLGKLGTINNFSYDPMPGEISQQELVTRVVHSYDNDEKVFNLDQNKNSINSVLSAYFDNYVTPFNGLSYDSAYSNFYPGAYRLQQKNIKNTFSIVAKDSEQRLSTGRNKALYSSIFLNNSVLFRVPGSTHRQAGGFIGIDREGAQPYSDFDSKILGVYFVVEVKHIFEKSEYFNDLRCVKTYSYDNLFLNTNIK